MKVNILGNKDKFTLVSDKTFIRYGIRMVRLKDKNGNVDDYSIMMIDIKNKKSVHGNKKNTLLSPISRKNIHNK